MHSFVVFQVDWPMLLFRSRPLIPCRDIIHVATSISCHDINLSLCSFELMVPDVATSISCRNISSCLCSFQLMVPDVATSISFRDINLRNCNLQLSTSYVATLISCRNIILDQRKTCHSFKALLLSRPPSFVATSTFVVTSRCCCDIIH